MSFIPGLRFFPTHKAALPVEEHQRPPAQGICPQERCQCAVRRQHAHGNGLHPEQSQWVSGHLQGPSMIPLQLAAATDTVAFMSYCLHVVKNIG